MASPLSRSYETENDLVLMQKLLMEGRALTNDWGFAHIDVLMDVFFMVACHLNPKEHIRLWFDQDKIVGYAILSEDPNFDFQVLPKYAWRGIEDEALAWADTRLRDLRTTDVERWGGQIVSGSHQDNARRIAFLVQHGFQPGGNFSEVNMMCSLEGQIPTAVLPPGFEIRSIAAQGEVSSRAEAIRDVWKPWTVGNVSDDNYAYFMLLPGYDRDLDVVAVAPGGTIAAYANGWIDPINRIGDIGPVGAREAYRRQGLTRAVMLECLHRMQARGLNRVVVSTGVSNTPAINLYQSVGFKIVNKYQEYVK